jgi:hypothetical protein
MPLASCATNVKQMPSDSLAVQFHVEYMLCDAHCLNAGMEDVV